jgi:hypothetical protein
MNVYVYESNKLKHDERAKCENKWLLFMSWGVEIFPLS